MKKSLLFVVIFLLISSVPSHAQALFINEIMSSNNKFFFDEDGDDSDWIEIYNNTRDPVNLSGYCLSDKSDKLNQWCFPDVAIEGYGYLIVFASNKNRREKGKELHTNFAISAGGEDIFLSYDGEIVHVLTAKELESNTSWGLFPDGDFQAFVFTTPTPGETNFYQAPFEQIQFSHDGGIYEQTFNLELLNNFPANRIFYTTDGSTPTVESNLYVSALELDTTFHSKRNISQILISPPVLHNPPPPSDVLKAILIKAAVFDAEGNMVSGVYTNSYFFKSLGINHYNLPIISISSDYDNLFNDHIGILVPGVYWDSLNPYWSGNYWVRGDDWEREAYAEFYETDNHGGFKQKVGLRTHGTSSRHKPQKGLKIYARSKYGMSKFNYTLFDDRKTNTFNTLILKPFSASWNFTGAEDYITNKIVTGLDIDGVASRPVVLYLNGEYWGIYFISERIDKDYFETYHNADPDNVDIIGTWHGIPEHGDDIDYLDMYEYVKNNDLSDAGNYMEISKRIDIDNFIDYQIFQIYVANYDWPANNFRCWRAKSPESKWRFAFFDGDACLMVHDLDMFEHALDTSDREWPSNAGSTLIFRKLMQNNIFFNKFISRMEEVLNKYLYYYNTSVYQKQALKFLEPEIYNQINRFYIPYNYEYWTIMMDVINNFLFERSCFLQEQIFARYGIELDLIECAPISVKDNISFDDYSGVFPNPSTGDIRIEFKPQHTGNYEFYMINLLGEKVYLDTKNLNQGVNDISYYSVSVPSGIYNIVIQNDSEYRSEKIIIMSE